jgi:hypothetical protein
VDIISLLNLPYGIGITIALAELAWGLIKYYTAPTPGQRREAVEEFYSIVKYNNWGNPNCRCGLLHEYCLKHWSLNCRALGITVPQISITLLLPSRTGRIGAWLSSFILVFSILLPMVVGY